MRKLLFLPFLLFTTLCFAQELNCTVQVVSPQIQQSDKRIFETLQTDIFEFMNNRRWTNDVFAQEERIECSILINVTNRVSANEFSATIQVQSRRPVYNSSYNTVMLNTSDPDFTFEYVEYQRLEFNENSFVSNLTSVLAYYANMIIGFDYESFSPDGGEPYFQKAMAIVNNAQGSQYKGWKQFEDTRNRYWLVENILNPRFELLRDCYYKYHRQGLDRMTADMETARVAITECLENIKKVRKDQPNSYLLNVWFNAKSDELVNIYSEAFPDVKNRAVELLQAADPSNSEKYQQILSSN